MTSDNLRNLSWRTFLAMFFFGVVGAALILAIPNPGYRDSSDLVVKVIGLAGLGFVGASYLASLISFVSGIIAWFKGTRHCGWILLSAIILFSPIIIIVASKLNL